VPLHVVYQYRTFTLQLTEFARVLRLKIINYRHIAFLISIFSTPSPLTDILQSQSRDLTQVPASLFHSLIHSRNSLCHSDGDRLRNRLLLRNARRLRHRNDRQDRTAGISTSTSSSPTDRDCRRRWRECKGGL